MLLLEGVKELDDAYMVLDVLKRCGLPFLQVCDLAPAMLLQLIGFHIILHLL